MSERANELPDGWRRDGDGTAYGPGGMEVAKIQYGERAGLWAIHPPGNEGCPRPRYFATEAGAIARAVELTRPSEGQLRVEVNGLDVAVSREPAPEPWTPKDGERVRVAMEDGTEVVCTVEDARPHLGTVVGVRFPGEDKRRLVRREYVCSHAAPAPDPRDAEIERLRAQVGEQSREIHGLKGELAAKPAAAPLPAEDRERLGRWLRSVVCGFEVDGEWDALSDASREHWRISADRGAYALQPDPARAAAAEKALERERWIEGTEADVFRGRSADGTWAWTVLSQAAERLGESVESYAAAIDAAMARHPLTREGE